MYIREDWTLFRTLETLTQQAGVPAQYLAKLVAKELADNALDMAGACTCGRVGFDGFFIADAGDGIPGSDEDIARLFSIKRPLTSSKLLRLPTRGALGNGLRVVVGAVLATGGTLTVSTRGRTLRLMPQDEGHTLAENIGEFAQAGTRIEVHLGQAAGSVDLQWVDLAALIAQGGTGYKGATSPFWYDGDAFYQLTQAAGERSVRDLIASFDGCTGQNAGIIAAPFKNRLVASLSREESRDLLCAARQVAKPVNPDRLGAVGVVCGLPDSYFRVTGTYNPATARNALSAVIPYVVEVWADFEDGGLYANVNRTPITGEVKAYHSKNQLVLFGCGLEYGIDVGKREPRLCLNLLTPYMPITSNGKAPDFRPFFHDIRTAIEKAVGKAKRQSGAQAEKKVTEKDVILNYLQEGVEKASGGGVYRFSQRQLYYAIRDISKKADLSWDNFVGVLTGYESEQGDIAGMYRDPRGILYHPHTRQEMPLGTLAVERYERPEWTFNKVLYVEKEGFFAVLKDTGWPERNDCALLTSKGFASRAARDVIDLMGETKEELSFYCVHDADASGTLIYQALQEATKARAARRVKIVNLGLEPEDALAMGLQPEKFTREKPAPVAEYVSQEWKEWLQTQRVELNAMTTPQFLDWLDSKFEKATGKVVPPVDVMAAQLEDDVEVHLQEVITERLLRKGRLEKRVARSLKRLQPTIEARVKDLREDVGEALEETPEHLWKAPVQEIAQDIAENLSLPVMPDVTPLYKGDPARN